MFGTATAVERLEASGPLEEEQEAKQRAETAQQGAEEDQKEAEKKEAQGETAACSPKLLVVEQKARTAQQDVAGDTVFDLVALPGSQVAWASHDGTWGIATPAQV